MRTDNTDVRDFKELQKKFLAQYESCFSDRFAKKVIVVVPSLSLDQDILSKIDGVNFYEERMLCMLMLLRMPNTHVVYVTSMPVHNIIMDYYLHLLPGITNYHARQRLKTLACFDFSSKSLTQKILDRPRLIERIRNSIPPGYTAHMMCFNVTVAERSLALQLNIPIYGCDPDLLFMGTKSFSRKLFKECNINTPPGFEDVQTENEVIQSLYTLKTSFPDLKKAVVKLNDGFSGDGNAVFSFNDSPDNNELENWIRQNLPSRLKMIANNLSYENFISKLNSMHGIVECFVEGEEVKFPSVQCRITPTGKIDIISTHDQVIGGSMGHVFIGAHFPANSNYAATIAAYGKVISEKLKENGVLGRFAVDFISVKQSNEWYHYAIEINLRKGGTTHPFLMLQFLTEGNYDEEKGIFLTPTGQQRFYFFSDNLQSEKYKGFTPHDLIEISTANDLFYNSSTQQGIMFHMIDALSQFGKLGVLCIGDSPERAMEYYYRIVYVLDNEKH